MSSGTCADTPLMLMVMRLSSAASNAGHRGHRTWSSQAVRVRQQPFVWFKLRAAWSDRCCPHSVPQTPPPWAGQLPPAAAAPWIITWQRLYHRHIVQVVPRPNLHLDLLLTRRGVGGRHGKVVGALPPLCFSAPLSLQFLSFGACHAQHLRQ
jgi:hypothetical protein